MDGSPAQAALPLQQVSLQTLVSVIQNAVVAQNLIATNIAKLTAAFNIAFPPPLTSSAAWTPGSVTNGSSASHNVTVSGAIVGDYAQASLGEDLQGCSLNAYVSAANTVTVTITNNTGSTVTFAATTVRVRVTTT